MPLSGIAPYILAAKPPPMSLPRMGKGDRVAVDRVLSLAVICAKTFFHLHHPPFIPPVPYPPLRGTFPLRGRLFMLRGASLFYAPHHHPEPANLNPEPNTKTPRLSTRRFYHNQTPISRLHMLPCHSVRRRQETGYPSPFLPPSPVHHGQACGPHRGSHS